MFVEKQIPLHPGAGTKWL